MKGVSRQGAPTLFPAAGQTETIRIYGYELKRAKGQQEYKIKFDLFSPDENRLVAKHFAYLVIVGGEERVFHRHHFYKVTFNRNLGHPLIMELVEFESPSSEA